MTTAQLPAGTRLGPVTLTVTSLDRSAGFYRDLVGLRELWREPGKLILGAGDRPVVQLVEDPALRPSMHRASGLFHTAILFPDRASLARVLRHIAARRYPFTGASDHLVSEALYLDDPDGHGVELYRDRPRDEWRWNGDTLEMATLPLDLEGLAASADREFDGAPDGTCVGHVHLRVADIAEAEAFYIGIAGFARTTTYGDSATFLAAGGYHHHLGANVWQSRGRPAAPDGYARLREMVIEVPTSADVQAFSARAEAAGTAAEAHGESGCLVRDPWGLRVLVQTPS